MYFLFCKRLQPNFLYSFQITTMCLTITRKILQGLNYPILMLKTVENVLEYASKRLFAKASNIVMKIVHFLKIEKNAS